VQTIADKTRDGQHILLVTSGAVQFGREVLSITKTEHENPQVLAALGW
jgi:glutamate 5-kinase